MVEGWAASSPHGGGEDIGNQPERCFVGRSKVRVIDGDGLIKAVEAGLAS